MPSKTHHLAAQRQPSYAPCWVVIFNNPRKRKAPTSSPLPLGNRDPDRLKPLSTILLTQLRLADCTRAFGKSTGFLFHAFTNTAWTKPAAGNSLAMNRMASHTFYSHICNLSNMDKPLPLSLYPACPRSQHPGWLRFCHHLRGRAAPDDGVRATTCARRQVRRPLGRGEWGGCYIDWTCKVNRATCLGDRL